MGSRHDRIGSGAQPSRCGADDPYVYVHARTSPALPQPAATRRVRPRRATTAASAAVGLVRAISVTIVVAVVSTLAAPPAHAATSLVTTGCAGGSIALGSAGAGAPALSTSDCTITFGDNAAGSMLKVYQGDGMGSAMWAPPTRALDTTFGVAGRRSTTIGTNVDVAYATAVQPDGKVLVAGSTASGGLENFLVARYDVDGTLDPTFSGDGLLAVNFGGDVEAARSVLVRPDGSIWLVGYGAATTIAPLDVAVARVDAAGVLDVTFNTTGKKLFDIGAFGNADAGMAAALQADGKVVIAGRSRTNTNTDHQMLVMRMNPGGALDTTGFNAAAAVPGSIRIDFASAGTHDQATAVTVDPNGAIVVAGFAGDLAVNGINDFAVARLTGGGVLDGTFNTTGKQLVQMSSFASPAPSDDRAQAIVRTSDGGYVVAGYANRTTVDAALLKLGSGGAIATTTFGTSGRLYIDYGAGSDGARAVTELPSGQLMVVGFAATSTQARDFGLARVQANGTLDTTYGTNGLGTTSFGSAATDDAQAIGWQSDGRLVAVGTTAGTDIVLARYSSPVIPDYISGDRDFVTGTGAFGACLHTAGTGVTARAFPVAGSGNCTTAAARRTNWRAVPAAADGVATIAAAPVGTGNVLALKFGYEPTVGTPVGPVVAPVAFDVVAPSVTTPTLTTAPVVSGTLREREQLTAGQGVWGGAPTTWLYQWQRCDIAGTNCVDIVGARSSRYVATAADVGSRLRTVVTAVNDGGPTTTETAAVLIAPARPYNTYANVVDIDAPAGHWRLGEAAGPTAANASGAGPAGTYAATGVSYDQTGALSGSADGAALLNGSSGYVALGSTAALQPAAFAVEGWFRTSVGTGTQPLYRWSAQGQALELVNGRLRGFFYNATPTLFEVWSPNAYADGAWHHVALSHLDGSLGLYVDGVLVGQAAAATTVSYGAGAASIGRDTAAARYFTGTLDEVALYPAGLSSGKVAEHYSAGRTARALPTVTGTRREGQVLTAASNGSWASTVTIDGYARQWERCSASGASCIPIPGEVGSTYQLTPDDVDAAVRVAVTATNAAGSTTSHSIPTGVVLPLPPVNTVDPSVPGTPREGTVVTGARGTWTSANAITYAYQWQRCAVGGGGCVAIPGATSQAYTPDVDDIDGTLRVAVTATNSGGSTSETSAASAVVLAAPPVNVTLPGITGIAMDTEAVTAANGAARWTSSRPITYTYEWRRCDDDGLNCQVISAAGASNTSYLLGMPEVDYTLRLRVVATNSGGSTPILSLPEMVLPLVPVGTIVPWAHPEAATLPDGSSAIPAGWRVARGQVMARPTFDDLWAVTGATYGNAGDVDPNTFQLPDMRDRFAFGASGGHPLGELFGAQSHTHGFSAPNHSHNVTVGGHSHTADYTHDHRYSGPASNQTITALNPIVRAMLPNNYFSNPFTVNNIALGLYPADTRTTAGAPIQGSLDAAGMPPFSSLTYIVKVSSRGDRSPCDAVWGFGMAPGAGGARSSNGVSTTSCFTGAAAPTVDLRGRFPIGAGTSFPYGNIGGALSRVHNVNFTAQRHAITVIPSHDHTVGSPGGHDHLLPTRSIAACGGGCPLVNTGNQWDQPDSNYWQTSDAYTSLTNPGPGNAAVEPAQTVNTTADKPIDVPSDTEIWAPYQAINYGQFDTAAYDVPTGTIAPFAGPVAPPGWTLADGRYVGCSGTYAGLCAAIGTQFDQTGDADASKFRLPDPVNRYALMADGTRPLGSIGGSLNHTHTFDAGAHSHQVSFADHRMNVTFANHRHTVTRGSVVELNECVPNECGSRIAAGVASFLTDSDGGATVSSSASGARVDLVSTTADQAPITSGNNNELPPAVATGYIIRL